LDLTDVNAVEEWMKAKDDAHFFSSRDCNTTTTTTTTTTNTLVCIHTAALSNPRQCQQDAARAHTLNVPTAFFDACQARGCAMICLSTDQVYCGSCPPYTDDEQQAERSTASLRPVNVYGATKLAMEQSVLQCPSKDAPSVILRSSINLGREAPILPEHAHDTFLHFCASRQGVETEFYTDERRTVVSVDDVIASIHWFVRDSCRRLPVVHVSTKDDIGTMPPPVTGIFNMGGPTSVSRFDMARAVFEHLGYDPVHLVAKE
jgi:dTDP-4-dehydrorhamnose reductase